MAYRLSEITRIIAELFHLLIPYAFHFKCVSYRYYTDFCVFKSMLRFWRRLWHCGRSFLTTRRGHQRLRGRYNPVTMTT